MRKSITAGLIAAVIGSSLLWADGINIPAPSWTYAITSLGTNVSTFLAANFTTNGALKANGSGAVSQAASTDLSDTTAATSWTPTDQSGATLTFTSVTGNFSKSNKTCVGTFRLTYPVNASGAGATISLPCTLVNNGGPAIGSCWSTAATPNGTLVLVGTANTATAQFINLSGGAASPSNTALATFIVTCNFAFITT